MGLGFIVGIFVAAIILADRKMNKIIKTILFITITASSTLGFWWFSYYIFSLA
jgi:hypothetical protein